VIVAFVPATPLLSPDVSVTDTGVAAVRAAARLVVAELVTSGVGIAVVGEAPQRRDYTGTWDWQAFGIPLRGTAGDPLPRALSVGAWLLDDAGFGGERRFVGVPAATTPADCAALGEELSGGALLVVADGSARRSLKAPGHLDERAEPFDAGVAAALSTADLAALTALDPDLAGALLAAGRAPWQVAAAAGRGRVWDAELLLSEAPYGVGWFVGRWTSKDL
jgi:hypothetical protein